MAKPATRRSSSSTSTSRRRRAAAAEDRAARHTPVSIPPGSYDRDALNSGLDAAVDRQGTNRQEEVEKALNKARTDVEGAAAALPPSAMPDYKFVEVPRELGEDGKVVASETIQVFDPGKSERHLEALQPTVIDTGAPLGLDDKGKPTDLEKARMEAVKGEGLTGTAAVTEPVAPTVEPQLPPAGGTPAPTTESPTDAGTGGQQE